MGVFPSQDIDKLASREHRKYCWLSIQLMRSPNEWCQTKLSLSKTPCSIMQVKSPSKAPCKPNPNTDAQNSNRKRHRKECQDIRPLSNAGTSPATCQWHSARQVLHKPVHISKPPLQICLFLTGRPRLGRLIVHVHRAPSAPVRVCTQV